MRLHKDFMIYISYVLSIWGSKNCLFFWLMLKIRKLNMEDAAWHGPWIEGVAARFLHDKAVIGDQLDLESDALEETITWWCFTYTIMALLTEACQLHWLFWSAVPNGTTPVRSLILRTTIEIKRLISAASRRSPCSGIGVDHLTWPPQAQWPSKSALKWPSFQNVNARYSPISGTLSWAFT